MICKQNSTYHFIFPFLFPLHCLIEVSEIYDEDECFRTREQLHTF